MPTAQLTQPSSGIDVGGLASLFLGKTSTATNSGGINTSTSQTTSENVSQAAVNGLVNSILNGSNGLAAVSSGEKRAGLYNTTTNQMLVNDLISRAAAAGAQLNKSSTVTTNQTQADTRATSTKTDPQINPAKALGAAGILQLLPSDLKKSIFDFGLKSAGVKTATGAVNGTDSDAPTEKAVQDFIDAHGSVNDNAPATSLANSSLSGSSSPDAVASVDTPVSNNVDVAGYLGGDVDYAGSGLDTSSAGDTGTPAPIDTSGDTSTGSTDTSTDTSTDSGNGFSDEDLTDLGFARGGLVTSGDNSYTHDATGRANALSDPRSLIAIADFVNAASAGNGFSDSPRTKYATGGLVDLTNTGIRINGNSGSVNGTQSTPTNNTQSINGISPVVATPIVKQSSGANSSNSSSSNSSSSNSSNSDEEGGDNNSNNLGASATPGAGGLGIAPGLASALGLGMTAGGIPGAGILGLANSANNSQAVNGLVAGLAAAFGGPIAGLAIGAMLGHNSSTASTSTSSTATEETPGLEDALANAMGMGMDDDSGTDVDTSAASDNDGDVGTGSTDASSSDSSGTSDVGTGSGGGDTGGGDDSGGGGSDSYNRGGKVTGPGTSTSDSIDANLSDGEYVINAHAVQAFGLPFLEAINNAFQPPAGSVKGDR